MKSVLKTFSQNTWSSLSKACLAALCVFVFSSAGNAQSFISVYDAQVKIRTIVQVIKDNETGDSAEDALVKQTDDSGQSVLVTVPLNQSVSDDGLRKLFYQQLAKAIGHREYAQAIPVALDETYQRFSSRYSNLIPDLDELKTEATNLLSN